jgi:ComF family protein
VLHAVYKALDAAAAVLLPPRCLLCHGAASTRGRDLCGPCETELPWLVAPCARCGLPRGPLETAASLDAGCARCRGSWQSHAACHAPLLYEFPLNEVLHALKYHGALAHARVLGTLLAESVMRAGVAGGVESVVPMPLHTSRLVERGFNQSLELARFVGAALRVELDLHALERSRATEPQVGLPRAARSANVRGAFVADASRVTQRHVALVDDVVTTGATVAAAAGALLEAGARRVDVWCVARALD